MWGIGRRPPQGPLCSNQVWTPKEMTTMRQQNPEIFPDRSADTAKRDTPHMVALSPLTEFFGIGMMLVLLLFS